MKPSVEHTPEDEAGRCRYSVVVPFHNEQESVEELYERLSTVMDGRFEPAEFIFVDDHSTDATPKLLAALTSKDSRVVMVRLKRNYGQTVALAAGFDHARGDVIISMDGDLQHDPADIPDMLAIFDQTEADIVSGWRKNRVDNFLLRRLPSRVANWTMAKLSGVEIHDFGTTFKVYRKETIKGIRLYGEMHRFIPALAALDGAKVVEAPIRNVVRSEGRSHYGLSRTMRVMFDLLTIRFMLKYLTRPLHFFGPIGLLTTLAGIVIMGWLLFKKLLYGIDLFQQHGPLMVLGAVLFLAGVQLISAGLIGEVVSRTYFESQGKPIYAVEKVVGRRA
ncbi:MAG TPA: glycosyltransferase family 2 protein [Blastocatellia bacterium]|nr:glycosyltransferase family 2 protein [Blastocatellia bacterium]